MAHLDPAEAFSHFKERALEAIGKQFPFDGRTRRLELESLEVDDKLDPADIRSQHRAKVEGGSWAVPVYARLSLRDKLTGNVIDSRRVRIAELPKPTVRHSFIVSGEHGQAQEYQVDSQWQLKPGAYTRRRQSGELETRFQVSGRPSFDITFDEASKQFRLEYGKAKLPLYPILKALGSTDDALERAWGKEIAVANRASRKHDAIEQFYRSTKKTAPENATQALTHLKESFAKSTLRPDSTDITLGKPFERVTGEALELATRKLLAVQAGAPEDDRDSIVFKDLRSIGDFAYDKLIAATPLIRAKVLRNINTADNVRQILKFDTLNKPIRDSFHKNSAVQLSKQVNPLEMVSSAQQTTIMGPGGIQSEQSIVDEAKYVNPSHLGYLDPIHTPEGSKTGVSLRLPMGVRRIGHEPRIPLYNLKSGKTEYVGPRKFLESTVALGDQVSWVNGKPRPVAPIVKVSGPGNEITEQKFDRADYVMRHPSEMLNVTTNLIPFLGNTSGGRASMATRHLEQAISLAHREAPLVQVRAPEDSGKERTFEQWLGRRAAHVAPIAGTVKEVRSDAVIVRCEDGREHEVHLYRHYPLNDPKSVLDSIPLVKPGDKVHRDQVIADTNFSKNGVLALGTNLRVGYLPFRGYNFEDGVVISETAARKLSSVHLHKDSLRLDPQMTVSKKLFVTQHPGAFKKTELESIGDDGVVRVGTRVRPGDPLVLASKKSLVIDRSGLGAIRKSLSRQHQNRALTWQGETDGEVTSVHKKGNEVVVHVKTIENMQVGDKLAGRYGNKGIVTRVIPDSEMPHLPDGTALEVALNPSGVPGRMNVGQLLETAAAKIAKKTGRPYLVENFARGDALERVERDLKKHGLSDTEPLFDPVTKQPLGRALVGYQTLLKLHHQVDKKVSVRSGLNLPGHEPEKYDINLSPSGGGHTGGQSMDALGLYALLAHGARANIREMQTWKSEGPDAQSSPSRRWPSQHHDVWDAIQHGEPLPTPRPTFAFHKFLSMLRAAGIHTEKKGHEFILTPLTDKQILEMTGDRALTKPAELLYTRIDPKTGDPKPKPGGLFDERLTGGHGGHRWSRIELAEPVPNPIFEDSIRMLTGLSAPNYHAVVSGEKAVDTKGNVVPLGKGATGGAGIKQLLEGVDVQRELALAKGALQRAPASKVDPILKRVKRLQMLADTGLKPVEAYVLHHLPVLPPVMRPVSVMSDGNFDYADINQLYSKFAQDNGQLGDPTLKTHLREMDKAELRRNLYDGVKAIMGIGVPYRDAEHKGLLHQIRGQQPKSGYFQGTLISRRQDMSMRSTIVPEPALGLDEVGLPKTHALRLFAPFVVRELKSSGVAKSVAEAQKLVAQGLPSAERALEKVVRDRPVLLKRDPALHKYSIQAFRPKLVSGNAIQIHPLVTSGYNADFDGDTMSVFVPISDDARREALKMMPSQNLFADATGRVMYQPTLESALGLYKLSRVKENEKPKAFSSYHAALEASRQGKLDVTHPVKIGSQTTTVGRILLATALPEPMQRPVLENLKLRIDRDGLDALLTQVAKDHREDFAPVANKLKDVGNGAAFGVVTVEHSNFVGANRFDPKLAVHVPVGTHSLSLADFRADKETRAKVLAEFLGRASSIEKGSRPNLDKERELVELWSKADRKLSAEHLAKHEASPSNLLLMAQAKVKPSLDQYKQMVLAPMLIRDASGRIIPRPITRSYAEGLDLGQYWQQMSGARRGSVLKVQQVREPGYLSKLLMASTMDLVVAADDCGTARGVSLPVSDRDVHDRYLVRPFSVGGVDVPAGTLLTPNVVARMRAANPRAEITVRSPLKCEHAKGICQRCIGLAAHGEPHAVGENVGVIAAQALGERAVQLTMKEFHTGGVASGGKSLVSSFERFNQLTQLPKKIPQAATVAMRSGTIEKVEQDPTGVKIWIDQRPHHVAKDAAGSPLWRPLSGSSVSAWRPPKVGMKVERGQVLSDPTRTVVNPHDLFQATGSMEAVQNHLASEIHKLYRGEGVKRQWVETLVKATSNLTKVKEPGDYPGVLSGEFHPHSRIAAINRELLQKRKRPIQHEPVLKGIDMLPLSLQEDWLAKLQHQRLEQSILEAAATMGRANVHGTHPIPAAAYGAEFGLTSKDVKGRPSLKHLENVPAHAY